MDNSISFYLYGRYALFCDPITKLGGEKCTYQVPTYQALKGIVESIYWKPTLQWHIDRVRVINKINTETKSMKPIVMSNASRPDLSIYTYLSNVAYQVQAHFDWNLNRKDMVNDRNENKHYFIAKRMLERGGRRDIFLGTRECQGYVEPCAFGSGSGFYDDYGEMSLGVMFHGFDYPDETGINEMWSRFVHVVMHNGVIDFIQPKECTMKRKIKDMKPFFMPTSGADEEGLMDA